MSKEKKKIEEEVTEKETDEEVTEKETDEEVTEKETDDIPEGFVQATSTEVFSAANVVARHVSRSDLSGIVAYKLSLLAAALQPVADAYQEGIKRLNEEFALRDEDGEILPQRNEQGEPTGNTTIDPRQLSEYDAAESEFSGIKNDIEWPLDRLKGIDLATRGKNAKIRDRGTVDTPVPFGGLTFYHLALFLDMTDYEEEIEK